MRSVPSGSLTNVPYLRSRELLSRLTVNEEEVI